MYRYVFSYFHVDYDHKWFLVYALHVDYDHKWFLVYARLTQCLQHLMLQKHELRL